MLSTYVLALLKRTENKTDELRELCTNELQDFLQDGMLPSHVFSLTSLFASRELFHHQLFFFLLFGQTETKNFIDQLFDFVKNMLSKKSATDRREDDRYSRARRDRSDEEERKAERKRRFEEREEERGRREREREKDTSSVGEREDLDSRNKRMKRSPEREKTPVRY